jgi:hypothetical protein
VKYFSVLFGFESQKFKEFEKENAEIKTDCKPVSNQRLRKSFFNEQPKAKGTNRFHN